MKKDCSICQYYHHMPQYELLEICMASRAPGNNVAPTCVDYAFSQKKVLMHIMNVLGNIMATSCMLWICTGFLVTSSLQIINIVFFLAFVTTLIMHWILQYVASKVA